MVIRNLDQRLGLVNGVQVVCEAIRSNTIIVRLPSGKKHVIPRINFSILPSASGLPFALMRRQYPLIPAYALTAHRVQGQTLKRLGIYFTGDAFCHGLLFTALSRVRSWLNVTVWRDFGTQGQCVLRNLVRSHVVAHLNKCNIYSWGWLACQMLCVSEQHRGMLIVGLVYLGPVLFRFFGTGDQASQAPGL
jgi:ATP-dependent DNA helicase PIF1